MIFNRLDGPAVYYRAHTPKWAATPLSGAGAAKVGGRANRPGVAALYLSESAETAIAEYKQLSPLMPPLTLVAYQVTLARIVDYRGGFDPAHWSPLWQEFDCDWRRLAFYDRIEPPSWVIADMVRESGAGGLLFPSQCSPGGINLVVYPDRFTSDDWISVHDPDDRLPRNQSSWTEPG